MKHFIRKVPGNNNEKFHLTGLRASERKSMDYTQLNDGKTKVSGLSLGTWSYADVSLWGACDREAAAATLREALDRGINLIDTAERDGRTDFLTGYFYVKNSRKMNTIYDGGLVYGGCASVCQRNY